MATPIPINNLVGMESLMAVLGTRTVVTASRSSLVGTESPMAALGIRVVDTANRINPVDMEMKVLDRVVG